MEWAPSDDAVIVNTDTGPMVFDPTCLDLLHHFETSYTQPELLTVNPAGSSMAAVSGTEIFLWDLGTGEILAEKGPYLIGHFLMEFVETANLYLGTIYGGGATSISPLDSALEPAESGVILEFTDLAYEFEDPVAVSPQGDHIAIRKDGIEIYGPGNINLVKRIDAFPSEMAFSQTGELLIALEGGCRGSVYSIEDGSMANSFEWCTRPKVSFVKRYGLEVDPSNHFFATSDGNGLIRVWEIGSAKEVAIKPGN